MTLPSLVSAVDDLYQAAVVHPGEWTDDAFVEWIDAVAGPEPPSPAQARELRRAVRVAVKLARFWSSPAADAHLGEEDWERRVDIAVGAPAWRPSLRLGIMALEETADAALFEHVAARFRLVNNTPFAGGLGYEEWLATR